MLFNSLLFLPFFAIVFAGVCLLRNRVVPRNALLLIAGWVFYGAWDWRFLFLLIGTSTFDYAIARGLDKIDPAQIARRKMLLAASVSANLLVLGFFKYCNFFVDSFVQLAHAVGVEMSVPTLRVILPVGVSFYTFQSIAYVVDVYRGHLRAERNWLHYATFVGFFPQLVAGPIERATHLLPQIKAPSAITRENLYHGFCLASFGMFKKIVLADNVAKIADAVFNASAAPTALESTLAIYAFTLQIYCDFSAYTDIARGCARMMGVDLMRNFDLPYFATNPPDFWRRWHISLSTWLRDYLYIPLGGNRGSSLLTYRNLALTMLLGGLWHGATWLFVAWGAYHGLLLILHRLLKPYFDKHLTFRAAWSRGVWTGIRIVLFFHLTAIGWLLFRAVTVDSLLRMVRPFATWSWDAPLIPPTLRLALCAIAITLLIAQLIKYLTRDHEVIFRIPAPVRAIIYAGLILGMIVFGEFGGGKFIYFQF